MYSRTQPFLSQIKERVLLTKPSSTKKTFHLVLHAKGLRDHYKAGDSIAVLPANDADEVERILQVIGSDGADTVLDFRTNMSMSIREFLLYKANLAKVNRAVIALLVDKGAGLESLLVPENKEDLTNFLHKHTLLEVLSYGKLAPFELAKTLMPLLPRFYSIASSPKVFPNEIHLLVSYVHYVENGQVRRGVGSHFLCDRAEIALTSIPIYVQKSHHFMLPENPDVPIILVGPGTGVAPFRAFLQERIATEAQGLNWLFFGERNRASDFYYESFWLELERQGRLRLDCAFSRDGKEKQYVQHKMYEARKSLWQWISEGAFFYLCGDAQEMAKDVDAMLLRIVKEEGDLSEEDALVYIKKMRVEKRYLADVY